MYEINKTKTLIVEYMIRTKIIGKITHTCTLLDKRLWLTAVI